MPTYTIKSATSTPKPDKGYGPMQSIALVLQEYGQSNEIAASWYTKANTDVPAPGSNMEFEISQGKYGLEARRPKQQGGGGFRAGRSPEENRRIVRQHSQDMAIRWAQLAHARGMLNEGFKTDDLLKLVDVFHKDAMEGGQ